MVKEKKRLLLRGDNTCRFGRHCNKEEKERAMARGRKRKIFGRGKKACTPLGWVAIEKKKSFNIEEKKREFQRMGECFNTKERKRFVKGGRKRERAGDG